METARQLRSQNIAEYILYLWQLEDLLRALKFEAEAVYARLIEPRKLDEAAAKNLLLWYMELAKLLREEGKEQSGHLIHTLHLIGELEQLHGQLLELPVGKRYRSLYEALAPEIPALKSRLQNSEIGDVELFFRALYSVVLLRLKEEAGAKGYIDDVLGLISPVVAELASAYHRAERGELDLSGRKTDALF